MLTYAAELSDPVVGKKIYRFIEEVLTDKKDLIMTYGQQLRNEGMQARTFDIAMSMLTRGYAPYEVGELTGLSEAAIRRMEAEAKRK